MDSIKMWVKNHPKIKRIVRLIINLSSPLLKNAPGGLLKYPNFILDFIRYKHMHGRAELLSLHPMLFEKTSYHCLDKHYFYQAVWAAKCIVSTSPPLHFDIASQDIFVGLLTTITRVKFIDLRPLNVSLENYEEQRGSITKLPMDDSSVKSLTCMHVAEHIGLGCYGDDLDPDGTQKACKELHRVLAVGGNLFFSMPVGHPRVEFNAHRVFTPRQVIELFDGLQLHEFSIVTDGGEFLRCVDIEGWENQNFACGLFWFVKPEERFTHA